MKASRILFGIGVGVAAGFVVALQGRDDKSVKNNTIDRTAPTVQNQNYNVNLKRLNKVLMTF